MIQIHFVNSEHEEIDTSHLVSIIKRMLKAEKAQAGQLQFIFCDDSYLLEINQRYLDHDTYTDIITFDYTEEFGKLSGDIFISLDRVRENAESYADTFQRELMRVMIHGILHLLGHRDGTDGEKEHMRARENYYLSLLK